MALPTTMQVHANSLLPIVDINNYIVNSLSNMTNVNIFNNLQLFERKTASTTLLSPMSTVTLLYILQFSSDSTTGASIKMEVMGH